jgi:GxxExxY protein
MLLMFGDANARWSKKAQRHVHRLSAMSTINDLSSSIIGAAIEVHRALGPGLLESAYQQCLARELALREIPFQQQLSLPVHYKGTRLDCGYRLDFLVAETIVVEVKAIDLLLPIHHAQLLSYLKLGGWKLGLLINFHVALLRDGIQRVVLGLEEPPKSAPQH